MRHHERMIMLSVLDSQWKDHLLSMDHLKEGIGLRGYGQHDPLVEYKKESFEMFEAMMQRFQEDTVRYLYLMQIIERPAEPAPRAPQQVTAEHPQLGSLNTPQPARGGNGHRPPRLVATSADDLRRSLHAPQAQTRTRTSPHGRRRRNAARATSRSRPGKSRPQRPLPLRLRQEIQKVPRRVNTSRRT